MGQADDPMERRNSAHSPYPPFPFLCTLVPRTPEASILQKRAEVHGGQPVNVSERALVLDLSDGFEG